jgi:biopolymer transport protein ExbD
MTDLNMTPLIDVMLVLIIMLIITIPKQNHSVNLGLGGGQVTKVSEVITVDVDFDGTVTWNGALVENRASLNLKLAEVAAVADQPELHVRPNKLVPYSYVAGVMAAAQRAGVDKIGMVGNEQFL